MRKTALVTGGAKRVGRAIVERLAREGFSVIFTYRSSAAEAAEVERAVPNTRGVPLDLNKEFAVADWMRDITSLDLLVNNASAYEPDETPGPSVELIRRQMRTNYEGTVLLTQAFAAALRNAKGAVVNMVDIAAEKPFGGYLAYSASKAALLSATKSLARELAPDVTVNGIGPGVVDWPADMPEADREKYLKYVPLARAGTPTDVAELVLFLATRGKYITGQLIRLDGGRSLI